MPDIPLERSARNVTVTCMLRHGRYGEFISCSGYPDCKYVKQNFVGREVPASARKAMSRKRRRVDGNYFYGCTNYPKCDSLRRISR